MGYSIVHETVARLGEQRGYPRYFVNARYLARAGFAHGQWLSIEIGDEKLTLRPVGGHTGKRVQEKNGAPLIDLNAKLLQHVFGSAKALHVRVCEKEITLSVHPLSAAPRERLSDGSMGAVFSGIGMLDQAAVQAGFTPKFAVEIDRRVADLYAENHPTATIFEMSAHEAAFTELPQVELLALGLPCQPWSQARTLNADGSKRDRSQPSTDHPLGDMAFWAFTIIARVNPRTIVLECAPGFIGGELCASLAGAIRRLGYDVESRVCNAHDYGALSKRRRSVLIATTPTNDGRGKSDPWALPVIAERPTFASILDASVPENAWWDRSTKAWIFAINERNAAKGNGFGFQKVTPQSQSCGTITAEYGETKNDQPVVAHPSKPDTYRFFTLAEGRRLFGLPATFKLPQAITFAWRMLGQGVYIPMFEEIIRRATGRAEPKEPQDRDGVLGDLLLAGA